MAQARREQPDEILLLRAVGKGSQRSRHSVLSLFGSLLEPAPACESSGAGSFVTDTDATHLLYSYLINIYFLVVALISLHLKCTSVTTSK